MVNKIISIFFVGVFIGICSGNLLDRIIGGQPANIQNYPYQISMSWTYGVAKPMHFCGGSIISKQHIVTAAHCVHEKDSPAMMRYIIVVAGTSRSDAGGKAYGVRRITIHPGYMGARNFYHNDIAIVTLNEPIVFSASAQPIKLPTRDIENGASAVVTGWGDTEADGETPIYLQKAPMTLLVSRQCEHQLPYYFIERTQVCAISRPGLGVCSGDSGGPLAVDGHLVGIASYVVECGKEYPDVYTNVYYYLSFIKQIVSRAV